MKRIIAIACTLLIGVNLCGCSNKDNTTTTSDSVTDELNSFASAVVDAIENSETENSETEDGETTSNSKADRNEEATDDVSDQIHKRPAGEVDTTEDTSSAAIQMMIAQKMSECATYSISKCTPEDYALYGNSDWQVLGITDYSVLCNKNVKNPSPWSIEFIGDIPDNISIGDYINVTFSDGYSFEELLSGDIINQHECLSREYTNITYSAAGRQVYYRAAYDTMVKDDVRSEEYHAAKEAAETRELYMTKLRDENSTLSSVDMQLNGDDLEITEQLEYGWNCRYIGTDTELQDKTFQLIAMQPVELPSKTKGTPEDILMRTKVEGIYEVDANTYRVMLGSNVTISVDY